jgi:hypothetical protein
MHDSLKLRKDSAGLPIQLDSLYLAGCRLTDFQCIPPGAGRKAVNTLRIFERGYPGD